MVAIRIRLAVPALPPAGSAYVAAGDSLTDASVDQAQIASCGLYASTLNAQFGWTATGLGLAASNQVVTAGSGYTSAPTISFVGGTMTRTPVAVAHVFNGGISGLVYSDYGAVTVAPTPTPAGGGFSVAGTLRATVTAGAITPPVINTVVNSWDGTRSAIASTLMQPVNAFDMGNTYVSRVTGRNPAVCTLWLGANDYFFATGSITPALYKSTYQTVIAALQALASKPLIVLLGLHPIQVAPGGGLPIYATSNNDLIRQFNQATAELAHQNGCVHVPLASLPTAYILGDGIHLTAAGQLWVADRVTDALLGGHW